MELLKRLFLSCIIFYATYTYSQTPLFVSNGTYKYFSGKSEPDTDWYKSSYNDAAWTAGFKSIGYGVINDSTTIDTVNSLYLRIKFNVTNKEIIKGANLFTDFSDGFVAYLNGNEIARRNLGIPGEFIPYNRLSDRSNEPIMYRNYFEPNGIYLDSIVLEKCLVNGDNILSVQVHNDRNKGKNLFFNSAIIDVSNAIYRFWNSVPFDTHNLEYNYYYRQVRLDSTKLPIVMINTDENGIPESHVKYIASMGIINNGSSKFNKPSDSFTDYNGRISIEIRGNNSNDMPKKSYRIETQEAGGSNLDVSLAGMPADNDWILYAPYMDKSLIRNELAFMVGRELGYYEPRTRYCELFLNGECQGVYVLMEKIKRAKNRINITKMYSQDNTGIGVTGGYILNNVNIPEYPKSDDITTQQNRYIQNYIRDFYLLLDKPAFLDPVSGYRKYIDEQTLIDYLIANELFKNCDSYLGSTYTYKDRDDADGRIKFGPLWDNDLAFGNAPNAWQQGERTDGWQYTVSTSLRITKILRDTSFANRFKMKWHQLRSSGFLSNTVLMNMIDSLTNTIDEDRKLNFKVWPIIEKDLYCNWASYPVNFSTTYEGAIDNLKNWISLRGQWIDDNINSIYYPYNNIISADVTGQKDRFNIFPNPCTDYLNIEYNIVASGTYSVRISDLNGKLITEIQHIYMNSGWGTYRFENENLMNLYKGLYILTISKGKNILHREKIVKL